MKKSKVVVLLLAFVLMFSAGMGVVEASSHGYVTTPTKIRGTWYHYVKRTHKYQTMRYTKYTANLGYGKTLSGKKQVAKQAPKYQLFAYKQGSYYEIGTAYTDNYIFVKRTTHRIHGKKRTALVEKFPMPNSPKKYWYASRVK